LSLTKKHTQCNCPITRHTQLTNTPPATLQTGSETSAQVINTHKHEMTAKRKLCSD